MSRSQPRVWWFSKNHHHTRFVYRLGQWVFSPLRGVRLSYRVPDLITLVINPVGNLVRPQLTELELLSYTKDGNEVERWIRWSRWNKLTSNVCDRQVHGRHGRAGSKLRSLSNILMCFHIVIFGLKVFMDARWLVTP